VESKLVTNQQFDLKPIASLVSGDTFNLQPLVVIAMTGGPLRNPFYC